jgi:hypothetical protein
MTWVVGPISADPDPAEPRAFDSLDRRNMSNPCQVKGVACRF